MLFNINNLEWDEELMQLLSIPPSLMPEVRPSAGLFGQTDPELTIKALPILGVLGDQQAALFGHGCLERGMMKNTYGTGCFLLMNTGEKPFITESGLLASVAWGLNGEVYYALEGSVFMGGAIIQWLRDELGLLGTASESEAMAMAVPDTNGVYFVPAFTGLGAPHWDPYARGSLQGLTRGANRNHIVRAALEGIAYQVGELIQSMAGATGATPTELRVDGGAAANNFLLQFQADLSKLSILRNSSVELTGIGAAYITGLTAGLWSDLHALQALVSLERTFIPRSDEEAREKSWAGWRRAVERAKNWAVE
jgi:glycerol kinase